MYVKKINKDKIRRILSRFFEIQIKVFKSLYLYSNLNVFNNILYTYLIKIFFSMHKFFFFNSVNNMCILTGRQNGVYKFFKISRIELRDSKHDIYGLKKSSW